MSNIENSEFFVRTVLKDDKIWWIAKDVEEFFYPEYKGIFSHWRCFIDSPRYHDYLEISSINRAGCDFSIIDEAGLHEIILRARCNKAMQISNWITQEALPAILGGSDLIYSKLGKDVKPIEVNGEKAWFAKEVAIALRRTGYLFPKTTYLSTIRIGRRVYSLVKEPELYKIIFTSNMSKAKEIASWTIKTLFPLIRKCDIEASPKVRPYLNALRLTLSLEALRATTSYKF